MYPIKDEPVEIFGVTLAVTGTFYPASAGGRFGPPSGEEFEIDTVTLDDTDVTELLSNLHTSKGDAAIDALAREAAHQFERHNTHKDTRTPPFVGTGD